MPHGSQVIHHMHKKAKTIEAVIKPKSKFQKMLDKLVYFTGLTTVLLSIPQVLEIWAYHNTAGISLITWSAFFVNSIIWTIYGIYHKELQIIIMYMCYFVINSLIVTGIIIYS